jgi:hypothetical protein
VSRDAFRRLALLFGTSAYALGLGLTLILGGWILAVFVAGYGFLLAFALTLELER